MSKIIKGNCKHQNTPSVVKCQQSLYSIIAFPSLGIHGRGFVDSDSSRRREALLGLRPARVNTPSSGSVNLILDYVLVLAYISYYDIIIILCPGSSKQF